MFSAAAVWRCSNITLRRECFGGSAESSSKCQRIRGCSEKDAKGQSAKQNSCLTRPMPRGIGGRLPFAQADLAGVCLTAASLGQSLQLRSNADPVLQRQPRLAGLDPTGGGVPALLSPKRSAQRFSTRPLLRLAQLCRQDSTGTHTAPARPEAGRPRGLSGRATALSGSSSAGAILRC
jgi:hypothetical protein